MAPPEPHHGSVATRLDQVSPAPDPPLTAILETLAALAATIVGTWGVPVAGVDHRRSRLVR